MPGEISDHDIERELQTLRYVIILFHSSGTFIHVFERTHPVVRPSTGYIHIEKYPSPGLTDRAGISEDEVYPPPAPAHSPSIPISLPRLHPLPHLYTHPPSHPTTTSPSPLPTVWTTAPSFGCPRTCIPNSPLANSRLFSNRTRTPMRL